MSTIPIVALDVASTGDALAVVEKLGDLCRFYKVGGQLFTAAGPRMIRVLIERGCDVFLDLKFHDIPNTVAGCVRSAAELGARLVTVHSSGGEAMVREAVNAASKFGTCDVLAVTVLTSLAGAEVASAWGRSDTLDVGVEVLRLAAIAAQAGAHGVVCGGREAYGVRERFGGSLAVLVPGIRTEGSAAGDQARVATPEEAVAAGARYIVLGRTVTRAADPRLAYQDITRHLV